MLISAPQIPGYQIREEIYAGSRTLVYRGIRASNSQPVVIKLLRQEYPNFSELVHFRNQYTITRNLVDIPSIIKSYSLEPYKNGYALVMEDFGGISLSQFIHTQPLKVEKISLWLPQFLPIAIQIAETLRQLQTTRVIHKDIKPANILIHPTSLEVKLIDFSIASLLPRETQEIQNPNILEGTLAYISPEQTGRMNRGIDYRSDFYSLGVTFYQLLTGKLPFQAEEAMELVHCHIAKQPSTLQQVNPQIPTVLSDIVMKLMAKNAEDRYQSALGIKHDLETCLHQLQSTGKISSFAIAQRDLSDRFTIPEKLYGREAEVKALLDAFERVAQGSTELMLVAGFSGIGKTAVVNEVHKPIVRQRGYFIKGKFDQFNRNIPFSAFVQAFRELIRQLLSEREPQLHAWKTKILQAVGENGQVIIEVIPELERLIGTQPPGSELSGSAAQNRFNLLFPKFVQVFTSIEHPLVIFLDDLQWSDSASLKLLQLLMNDAGHLLILGAYRDNEVSPVHPLMLTINELEKTGKSVNTITLQPLSQADINQLVSGTLSGVAAASQHRTLAQPLTELVYQKTKGNPFFTTQFLKALHEDRFIQFNPNAGYWQCDISQIKVQSLTDDVVEFMAQQLRKLPQDTQEVLKLAACIGAQFDWHTLAVVSEQSEVETATALWKALREGLIIPLNETYKFFQEDMGLVETTQSIAVPYRFLHDRVQQAAYSLIPEPERASTHYQIGQLLLQQISPKAIEEQIFVVVNQLNYGTGLIEDQTERDDLARLNLSACRKARAATAYQAAQEYAAIGLNLLGSNGWAKQYEMTLNLHEIGAEVASLCGNFEEMNQRIDAVVGHTHTTLERVGVFIVKIQALASQNKFLEAISIGQSMLKELGIEFPDTPALEDIQQAVQEINVLLGERPIEELFYLKAMADPHKLATMQVAVTIMPLCHMAGSPLFPLMIALLVNLSLRYGNSPASAWSYAGYGVFTVKFLQDVNAATQFGRLAYRLASVTDTQDTRAETVVPIGLFLHHRQSHLRETLPIFQTGYEAGLATGKLDQVGYNAHSFCFSAYWCGEFLGELEPQIRAFRQQLIGFKQVTSANYCLLYLETTLFLMGNPDGKTLSFEQAADEENLLYESLAANDLFRVFVFYMHRAILKFLVGDIAQATADAALARQYLAGGAGYFTEPGLYFYDSLITLATLSDSAAELAAQQQRIQENQAKLQHWAEYAPMNHLHKWQLVEAEKYRRLGQKTEAIERYDKAIAIAQENGYIQEEALANELAAKFYLDWGKEKVAAGYMQEAYYCYSRWGAKVKVIDLEERYPQLLTPILQSATNSSLNFQETLTTIQGTASNTSSASISKLLDIDSILKISQSFYSEIRLEQLVAQIMQVVVENAGANKGVLLLNNEGILEVSVQYRDTQVQSLADCSLDSCVQLPRSIILYVERTLEEVFSSKDIPGTFVADPYFSADSPQSLLCVPILHQGKLIGILYLETTVTANAFTSERVELLKLLCTQAAISLENARLYQQAQQRLTDLKQAQLQIVQSEKMSALGNLVAGVAHEINNPVSFLVGNIQPALDSVKDLFGLLDLYQEKFPQPGKEIEEGIEEIDLEYIREDLPKLIGSMKAGVDRIRDISLSLRTFSRADSDYPVPFNLHEGINSTILILKHRLKANDTRPAIEVVKKYGKLPMVECYAGQINQVFMNILANSIDAIEESNRDKSYQQIQALPNYITISTEVEVAGNFAIVRIQDNGMGMSDEVRARIFDHLFTTKGVGKGTGLGLAIARQIVVEKHNGSLFVNSTLGQGAEFVITLPVKSPVVRSNG